ncbi:MAG: LptF/LptG family permease [Prosthecobacter sp.]|uniref:LptF/LptG family permease n=1 Tax=Prosthecobacter sp. TaxID=1965333 RepID=UPI0039031B84
MKWQQRVIQAWQKARELPYLGRGSFAVAIGWVVLAIALGWHRTHPDDAAGEAIQQAQMAQMAVPKGILVLAGVLPYLNLWVTLGTMVLLLVIWRRWGDLRRLMFPVSVASVSLAVWVIASELVEYIAHSQMTEMGEPPAPVAFAFKLVSITLALLSVPFALHYYRRTGLLERYTLRTFAHPLVFCFVSFCSLWIIMDLLDNLKDFQYAKSSFGEVLGFYLGLLPYIYVTVMPVALLLAALYALTRMSRANEIISMLGAGRSLGQVLQPIFLCTVYAAFLSLAANYYWAPRAEGNRKAVVRALAEKGADSIMASSIMFRNEQTHRTWFAATFPFSLRSGQARMHGVQVREEHADGTPARTILAPTASWTPRGGWRFYDGSEMIYQDGQVTAIRPFPARSDGQRILEVPGIEETPWSIVSYALRADFMSVPEIVSYLQAHPKAADDKLAPFRTHFWHRFALPWQALALVLVAAPLGVAYSRRGSVGGIAGSVFIFFIFMFVNNLFLNLGKGGHLPPWFTVWVPHLLFGSLGLVLFHFRSQNRDLPSFKFKLSKLKPQIARPRNRRTPLPDASGT